MLRPMRFVASVGMFALIGLPGVATAQLFPGYNPCQQCVQPVAQTCYQTVPVTEYRPVKQTVRRPVVETRYVDQKVTAYRPVTETKTASIPTVTYENVTECRSVQRDCGFWQTNYYRNPKVSPCQYDPRPNLLGWLNRTGYSIRQTFTPDVVKRRQYVPRVVTQMIPVTRRVAKHGTRQVTYNVTRMEPYTTTRKVAVNEVRYVSQEVTSMRPVTVMRTVPIGTSVAFAPIGYGTATALQPTPDPIGTASDRQNRPRTADSSSGQFDEPAERFQRDDLNGQGARIETTVPSRQANFTVPTRAKAEQPAPQASSDDRFEGYRPVNDSHRGSKYPTVIRAGRGWKSRHQTSASRPAPRPSVSLAARNR